MAQEAAPVKRSIRLIIAVAAIGLAIGAYFIIKNRPTNTEEYVPFADRIDLMEVKEADLTEINFIRENDRLTIVQVEEDWEVVYPAVDVELETRSINDIAYTMSNLYTDQIIEEEPEDLSQYGLDDPQVRAEIVTKDGTKRVVVLGDRSASGIGYYAQIEGESRVFVLRRYSAEKFFTEIEEFRDREIAMPNMQDLQYLKIVEDRTLEISRIEEGEEWVGFVMAGFKVTQPYNRPRVADSTRLGELMEQFPGTLRIEEFVDDNPTNLSQYGLEPPQLTLTLQDSENRFELLLGNPIDNDTLYAMVMGQRRVFAIKNSTIDFLFGIEPFSLVDKFVLIINIEDVDRLVVKGFGKSYESEIKRTVLEDGEEEASYFINGRKIEEDPYKKWYQLAIGLLSDAENPSPNPLSQADVTITYHLHEGPERIVSAEFEEINRDFFAAYRYGESEFLVSDYQIEAIFEGAEEVLKGEETGFSPVSE